LGAATFEAAANVAADTITADQQISDRAELARVQTAIATLPQAIREPLVLRTIEGMTQAEAAQVLGISEKAVETRLYRARGQLSELLRV
jgi:RNA polymerase sigma-70 factor (ECF subfamily)